jgi:hypothetical protein
VESASLDDEYFRLALSLRADLYEHSEIQKLMPAVFRSFQKPFKQKYRRAFFRNIVDVDVTSAGGIYLGTAPGLNVNLKRLVRVPARIVKGLFFHEFKTRLPDGYEVVAYSESGLKNVKQEVLQDLRNKCTLLQAKAAKTIGSVLSY